MPTLLHECHGNWMRNVEDDWREQNLVTGRQLRNLTMLMSPCKYSAAILYDIANSGQCNHVSLALTPTREKNRIIA
jgi:hypothetical protein